jgi:hypothetical protein
MGVANRFPKELEEEVREVEEVEGFLLLRELELL